MNKEKLFQNIINSQKNMRFEDFVLIVTYFKFKLDRINGSHHIYKNVEIGVCINMQNDKGKAKPYQIKQFLKIVEEFNLKMEVAE